MSELLFKEEVFRIVGAAMTVSSELGSGFLEAVYQEAMEIELNDCRIPFEPQKRIRIHYKDQLLRKEYIADFLCFNSIIVEIKAIKKISLLEEAQLLNYLHVDFRCLEKNAIRNIAEEKQTVFQQLILILPEIQTV